MSRRSFQFSNVRSEGGLLPQDVLSRIQAGDKDLPGLTPESYHLGPHERISEAVNRAWRRLASAWRAFQEALAKEPDAAKATGLTRDRWLLPLFQELGYGRLPKGQAIEVRDKSYAVSHMWYLSPIHLLGVGVDLDLRQAGVSGAAKASPHGLVQEFLNRSEHHLWGFVSNGLELRVLRDHHSLTRQSYVEFDLQSIMEGEQYSEFLLLWMVCHQSRIEAERPDECWLEQWFNTSRKEGVSALEKMFAGAKAAIEAFGTGFLAHRANTKLHDSLEKGDLDKQDYYRQALRLVYRLIFLFVAEERDALLDPQADDAAKDRYLRFYATRRLRELSEKRRGGPHSDLWQGLRLVMSKLDNGCPELALPALGSRLWGPTACSALMEAECTNEHLLGAVRHLSNVEEGRTRYPVNWRSVGAEELGSIYEGLLELHPRINKEAGTFVLETAPGHERKLTGSYYTPTELVDCLLDAALNPVLDSACKKPNPEGAILDIKVCDPACGSGHFLVAAARRIAKRLAAVRAGEDEPSPREVQHALRDIVGLCIYGVDVNPMAVELCKVSLWMEAIEPGRPLSFLDSHIQCGNALLGATPALMARGIPDDAFKSVEGDDKKVASELKKRNKREREALEAGQGTMFTSFDKAASRDLAAIAERNKEVEGQADHDIGALRAKEERWENLTRSHEFKDAWFRADSWCAAFLWPKQPGEIAAAAITEDRWRGICQDTSAAPQLTRETVRKLAQRNRFFHWQLAFPQVFSLVPDAQRVHNGGLTGWHGGFDAFIGNPPWIRQELLRSQKPLLAAFESYVSTADSSVYFLELGLRAIGPGGFVGMLTPNKWFRANYADGLRKLLKERTDLRLLVDFGHSKTLFPDADTFPAAVAFSRARNTNDDRALCFVRAFDEDRRRCSLADLVRDHGVSVSYRFLSEAGWRLENDAVNALLKQLTTSHPPLSDWLERPPLSGIKTGLNEAYYLSADEHRALTRAYPDSEVLLLKVLRGRDIARWQTRWDGYWHLVLESSQNREWPWSNLDEGQAEKAFEALYPGVYLRLQPFKQALQQRADRGTFWWELRSCDYYSTLLGPKIVVQCIAFHSRFAKDSGGHLVNNKAIAIPTTDSFILGILNSRTAWWVIYRTFQRMKDDGISVDVNAISRLPIPKCDAAVRARVSRCVDGLLVAAETDVREFEHDLNQAVYEAYGLDAAAVRVLESSLPPRDPLNVAYALEPETEPATSVEVRAPAVATPSADTRRDLPAMPSVVPTLEPAREAAVCVWALLHTAGGAIARTELARAFALRSQPTLLEKLAPPEIQSAAAAWASRVANRSVDSGALASAVSTLADRDGISLTTDSAGRSIVTTTKHTPPEAQIDDWFRFEARLALRVLAAVPAASVQEVDSVISDADRVVLRSVGGA
jgi:Eco57I restriction-modification methylase/N-6 DNA Methylase/TaqI-like C-terminal specificity domain